MKHYTRFIAKFIGAFLSIILTLSNISTVRAQRLDKTENLSINARAYIALDVNSKSVLVENNSEIIMPMASTTKILTALVALKYGDLDKKIEISKRSAGIQGSTVGYSKGEKISLLELIYGLMLRSGNDAAIAIAEGISGSVEEFVKVMNEYALNLGLIDTHFYSPHGLDNEEHYTTAYDMALITSEAKKSDIFNRIVRSKQVDGNAYGFSRSYNNINKILWLMPFADGVKTGYTGQAGKCLVTSADFKGHEIVIVVFNAPERWKETIKIFNYIEKNFEYKKFFSKGDIIAHGPKVDPKISLQCKNDIVLPIKNGDDFEAKIIIPKEIKAGINKGDNVGRICILNKDKIVYSDNLAAGNDYKIGWLKKINIFNRISKK
ncbi:MULTISPECIES: D-alanyl-D-alanine carboxypeptidase family protein [unclassified Clostridium]|uniref:D-alanyl-D-alanine carboxypeptidase family protein n=1 Tax=unclassified Clostridium TaxID=2614128 RepID=UPI00068BA4A6|nr:MULTISPECIES: D-alanyl-D-alanine carboxypeptidase family protein [unclassified Clostridium]